MHESMVPKAPAGAGVTTTTPYVELPVSDGIRLSWGAWGPDDVLGCLNRLDPAAVIHGRDSVRRGVCFSVNWDMALPDPPLFRRPRLRHTILAHGSASNDVISDWNTQGSSQWDGFLHISWPDHGHYGGHELNGMQHWAVRGIVGRCVLADVGRWRAHVGRPLDFSRPDPVSAEELRATLEWQGSTLASGDVLVIRFGWIEWYESIDAAERARIAAPGGLVCPGLSAAEDTVELLWDSQVAAVAADNPTVEPWPQQCEARPGIQASADGSWAASMPVSLHRRLLPALGMPLGELWDLTALAADAADHGSYDGLLVSAPLNLAGGVASPANCLVLR